MKDFQNPTATELYRSLSLHLPSLCPLVVKLWPRISVSAWNQTASRDLYFMLPLSPCALGAKSGQLGAAHESCHDRQPVICRISPVLTRRNSDPWKDYSQIARHRGLRHRRRKIR